MAKGSGGTRGAKNSSTTTKSKSDSYKISTKEYNRRQGVFRSLGAAPVPNDIARQYKASTGLNMPNDAIYMRFGRSALSDNVVEQTLSLKEYSGIRKVDWFDKIDNSYETFFTGYKSEAQLVSFLKDCRTGAKAITRDKNGMKNLRRVEKMISSGLL